MLPPVSHGSTTHVADTALGVFYSLVQSSGEFLIVSQRFLQLKCESIALFLARRL
jgi:hypothetical protein